MKVSVFLSYSPALPNKYFLTQDDYERMVTQLINDRIKVFYITDKGLDIDLDYTIGYNDAAVDTKLLGQCFVNGDLGEVDALDLKRYCERALYNPYLGKVNPEQELEIRKMDYFASTLTSNLYRAFRPALKKTSKRKV